MAGYDYDPYVGPTYGAPNIKQYSPQSQPMSTAGGGRNSSFWNDWASSIQGGAASGGSGGIGSQVGGLGGSAIGSMWGPTGGAIGGALGSMGGDLLEGGIMGGDDESGQSKLADEQKQSEQIQRTWEIKNAVPTAGIGQYMARALALQGMPLLGAINNIDFLVNKVMPYTNQYLPGLTGKNKKRRKR